MNKVEAPRASIDITRVSATRAHVHGRPGTRIRWVVRDVRTVRQDHRSGFYQRFVVDTNRHQRDVTVRRHGAVQAVRYGHVWSCPRATRHFDDATNVVRVFVPDSCVGRFSAATAEAVLIDDNKLYSRDVTSRLRW